MKQYNVYTCVEDDIEDPTDKELEEKTNDITLPQCARASLWAKLLYLRTGVNL
jgi:hypothetical protein